jgi:para-aminobenzoate synthetase component 1
VNQEFHSELPLSRAIEVTDPLAATRALAHLPYPFLLHSSPPSEESRWSFFGADPFVIFRGDDYDDALDLWRRLSDQVLAGDPSPTLVPFTGGVVGYWAYDFGRRLERIPSLAADDVGLPDVLLAFYDVVGAYDHVARQAWLFSSGLPLDDEGLRRARAGQRLDQLELALTSARPALGPLPQRRRELTRPGSTFTPDAYRRAIERVQEHIRAGDIFQANLSQRWTVSTEGADVTATAFALNDALNLFSPAPYSGLLVTPEHAVVSSSPERFVELRGARVETRPIKGTRPRVADPAEDQRLRRELLESAKDRAENVMIVDVLRNDLGRVSLAGTVEATRLCELESFPHVHHLVSTITSELREELDAFDLLHACFPGGSITGAPKIRAMEILERLEPVRRHIYTGSLGYVDWRGDADWNIAIRTALVTPRAIHFAAGGGITAESDPDAEFQETLHKAEGMRQALERMIGPIALEPLLAGSR